VVYREDFAAAEIPTLPVVASESRVRRGIAVSALVTVATAVLPLASAGPVYAAAVLPAAALFLLAYWPFVRGGGDQRAVRAFFSSNVFLAAAFLGWALSGVATGRLVAAGVALAPVGLFVAVWSRRPRLGGVRAAPGPDWDALATRARDRLRVQSGGP